MCSVMVMIASKYGEADAVEAHFRTRCTICKIEYEAVKMKKLNQLNQLNELLKDEKKGKSIGVSIVKRLIGLIIY